MEIEARHNQNSVGSLPSLPWGS